MRNSPRRFLAGTLEQLEATREFAETRLLVFTSTNKVYGDMPNGLPVIRALQSLIEETVWLASMEASAARGYESRWPKDKGLDQYARVTLETVAVE